MRVPLIISPSGQPLSKAQHPCKPPRKGYPKGQNKKAISRSEKIANCKSAYVKFYCILEYINRFNQIKTQVKIIYIS